MNKPKSLPWYKAVANKAASLFSSQTVVPSSYSNSDFKPWIFGVGNNGSDVYIDLKSSGSIKEAYQKCPPIASIVHKQASAFVSGKTWLLDNSGKEATGSIADLWRKKLSSPNPLQTWTQFEKQMIVYLSLYEYCVIFPVYSVGFEDVPVNIWIIPGDIVQFEKSNNAFFSSTSQFIKNIIISYQGDTTTLPAEQFVILRGDSPNMCDPIIPQSRLIPIQKNINNIIGLYESKNVLINQRGAMGILSQEKDTSGMGNTPLPKGEKEDIQRELMMYGLRAGQSKYIISNASLKWTSMMMPYKDLMFSEWAQDDTMVIADALNYPYRLLASEKAASYNDVKEFKVLLYQDHIIPLSKLLYEQLSVGLKLNQIGLQLDKDYSMVPALQEDDQKRAQARKMRNEALQIEFYNNLITLDMWRIKNDEDPIGGEHGSSYYYQLLQKGYVFGQPKTSIQNEKEEVK